MIRLAALALLLALAVPSRAHADGGGTGDVRAYTRIGENLATGQRSAREVVEQWMRSRGHRATILGTFEDAGIAIAEGSPTGRARGYTVVALYGRDR